MNDRRTLATIAKVARSRPRPLVCPCGGSTTLADAVNTCTICGRVHATLATLVLKEEP